MWTRTCGRPVSSGLILAALALSAAPAAADYRESYRRGVEAAGRESWSDVARLMRAALAEQPREGEPMPFDGRSERYLPRYYLGLALFHSANCLGARREWERGKEAIKASPLLFRNVEKLNQECQRRLPREAAAGQSARAVDADLRKAERLANAVGLLGSNPAIGAEERDALERALREARERLADAQSRLDQGRRDADLGDLDKARELTQRATADIEKARRRAMSGLGPADVARGGAAGGPLTEAAPPRPPVELVSAAHAYFEGRYEDVVRTLGDVRYDSGPAAVQAPLLRAAARHALYVLGGAKDEALRRSVAEDVQAVRRIDPSFEPDAEAFSPRFRELFRSGG